MDYMMISLIMSNMYLFSKDFSILAQLRCTNILDHMWHVSNLWTQLLGCTGQSNFCSSNHVEHAVFKKFVQKADLQIKISKLQIKHMFSEEVILKVT